MDISLIIPIYNQTNSLECVLESLKYLRYPIDQYEVIIIDDGSSEPTQEIVRKHQGNIQLKYIRHKNNKGRAAARNTGASVASGKILVFSDGDRILSPGFLEEHTKNIFKNVVCIGKAVEIFKQVPPNKINEFVSDVLNETNNVLRFVFNYGYQELVFKIYDDAGKNTSNIPWITLLSGNFSIEKNIFDYIGGFDENFKSWGLENIEFGYRVFKAGMEFVYDKNAINYHLYHDSNRIPHLMSNSMSYFYQKHQDMNILKYFKFINGNIPLSDLDNSLERLFFNSSKIGTRYKRGIYI